MIYHIRKDDTSIWEKQSEEVKELCVDVPGTGYVGISIKDGGILQIVSVGPVVIQVQQFKGNVK